jgi:protein-S-isoprenylcysteine O-methyltransferase Ste14
MWKLFGGIGIAVLGVLSFLLSLQYGSLLTAAGNDGAIRDRYNFVSALLGYGGVLIFLFGVGFTIWAIRRMNAETRKALPPS